MGTRITVLKVIVVLAVGAAGLMACRDSHAPETHDTPAAGPLTFTRDVAPIVFQECATCHRPEGSAPFSVLNYQEVKARAHTIVTLTQRRFMPPWLPEPGYGEFAGERRLTDAQIETIQRWHAQGAVEGNPADLPPPPRFAEGWQLGEPDLIIKLPRPYTLRADGVDVWRNFVIPIPVSTTRHVRTVELRPGNARVVHHALIGVDPTRSSRRRDQRDPDAGFDGMDMGDAQAPDGHLLGWTPGMVPVPGIEGKAWRLERGTDLVLQLHLMPPHTSEVLDPIVGLYFAESPPLGPPLYLLRLDADHAIDIPPGEKRFVVTDTFELPVDVEVLAAYPHAHFLARTMEGLATLPDGTERWLIRIRDWDFKWQDVYRYARPIPLPKKTIIRMRYTYDNSADNPRNPSRPPKRVVAGPRSSDEMAHLQLQVRTHRAGDLLVLKEGLYRHALRNNPHDAWVYYELGNVLRDQGRLREAMDQYRAALHLEPGHAATRNNLGVLLAEHGSLNEAIAHYREALRVEPDFADAHYNLGNALRAGGTLDEALDHYREALRLEPDFAEVHTNLGEVLASQQKLDEAIVHFREAVRLTPDSAEAHNNLGAGLGVQGKIDEAVSHFRRALQLQPDHRGARENLRIALAGAGSAGRVKR